jgi:hypothetical protein
MKKRFKIFALFLTLNSFQLTAKEKPLSKHEKQVFYSSSIKTPSIKKNKSRDKIKKLCIKSKRKITALEARARRKSTPKIQRCKRAWSKLRYQTCHQKKYHQRKIDAAKNCAR